MVAPVVKEVKVTSQPAKMSAKVNNSLTDQQPAAPKVVLPVIKPSASSTNVAKQVAEVREEDKDGNYFMNVRSALY